MPTRHSNVRATGRRVVATLGLGATVMAVAACGAASPGGPADPTAGPGSTSTAAAQMTDEATTLPTEAAPASGVVLELKAQQPPGKDTGWDVWELTAPAGKTWDVAYTNADQARHDFAIVPPGGFMSDLLFKSEMVAPDESATITVPALAAGTYDFVCSLHSASMRGTLTIE